MNQLLITIQVIVPVLFPILCGIILLVCGKKKGNRKARNMAVFGVLAVQILLTLLAWQGRDQEVVF